MGIFGPVTFDPLIGFFFRNCVIVCMAINGMCGFTIGVVVWFGFLQIIG